MIAIPTIFTLYGVLSWSTGTARLLVPGLPDVACHNLDPQTRLYREDIGCGGLPGMEFSVTPYNVAVLTMCRWFGPQPRAYRGPYPSLEEAEQRLRSSKTNLAAWDVVNCELEVDGADIVLAHPSSMWRIEPLLYSESDPYSLSTDPIRACVLKGQCLILGHLDDPESRVYMIDISRGKLFAVLSKNFPTGPSPPGPAARESSPAVSAVGTAL